MSFLSDIAELAKAGYKPQDVKDLLSMSKPEPGASPLPGGPGLDGPAAHPWPKGGACIHRSAGKKAAPDEAKGNGLFLRQLPGLSAL